MKIIKNPSLKIPDIKESDIYSKIIMSVERDVTFGYESTCSKRYINYMKKIDNKLKFRGCRISWTVHEPVTWTDIYNNGDSIMDLLIKEYNSLLEQHHETTFYVIESGKELKKFIKFHELSNSELEEELLAYWQELKLNRRCH